MEKAIRKANEKKDISKTCPIWAPDQEDYLRVRINTLKNAPEKRWSKKNDKGETEWSTHKHLAEECYNDKKEIFADKTMQCIMWKIAFASSWIGKKYTSSWHPTQTEHLYDIAREMNERGWCNENGDELKPNDVAKQHEKDKILRNKNFNQIFRKIEKVFAVSMFWDFTLFTNQFD